MPVYDELSIELQTELKRLNHAGGEVVTEHANPERYRRVQQLLDAAYVVGYHLESQDDRGIQVMGLTEAGRRILQLVDL